MNEIQKFLQNGVSEEVHRRILERLNYLGMQCIRIARSLNTYTDRTSNLRNSIGYIILKDGVVVDSIFPVNGGGSESGEKGKAEGEKHAQKVGQQYPTGYALIVVAGMEYAGYVEDVHNLAVLKPAEDFARGKAERIMGEILNSIKRR